MAAHYDGDDGPDYHYTLGDRVSDFFETSLGLATAIALFLAFVLGGILLLGSFFESRACMARYADSGVRARWEFHAGCRLLLDGQWLPESKFKPVIVEMKNPDAGVVTFKKGK